MNENRVCVCVIRFTLDKEANVAESTESCKTNEESGWWFGDEIIIGKNREREEKHKQI